jgi:hypothetical protein
VIISTSNNQCENGGEAMMDDEVKAAGRKTKQEKHID